MSEQVKTKQPDKSNPETNTTAPPANSSNESGKNEQSWATILSSIRSPLSLFALTVLICNAVFALSAARLQSLTAFIYSMHLFLGIIGAFTLIAIWSPGTLYHPKDMPEKDIKDVRAQFRANIIITTVLMVCLFLYAGWELFKFYTNNSPEQQIAQAIKQIRDTGEGTYSIVCDQHVDKKSGGKILQERELPSLICTVTIKSGERDHANDK